MESLVFVFYLNQNECLTFPEIPSQNKKMKKEQDPLEAINIKMDYGFDDEDNDEDDDEDDPFNTDSDSDDDYRAQKPDLKSESESEDEATPEENLSAEDLSPEEDKE